MSPKQHCKDVSQIHERRDERDVIHDSTGIPERVVGRCQGSAVGRVGDLGNQHGGSTGGESETETDEETSANEHANRLGRCLDCGGDQHDHGTNEDGSTTAETISEVGGYGVGSKGTNILKISKDKQKNQCCRVNGTNLDGVEKTQF